MLRWLLRTAAERVLVPFVARGFVLRRDRFFWQPVISIDNTAAGATDTLPFLVHRPLLSILASHTGQFSIAEIWKTASRVREQRKENLLFESRAASDAARLSSNFPYSRCEAHEVQLSKSELENFLHGERYSFFLLFSFRSEQLENYNVFRCSCTFQISFPQAISAFNPRGPTAKRSLIRA